MGAVLCCGAICFAYEAPVGHGGLVAQATQQSAAGARIESLSGNRARIPSPLQALVAEAGGTGLTENSTARGEPGSFRLRALSLARCDGQRVSVGEGHVSVDRATVQVTHPNLVEELTTSADGVRHDFLVAQRPAGQGELRLTLAVKGVKLAPRGDAVALTLPGGRVLLYRELNVTDHAGKKLPARFEVAGADTLHIVVDDRAARYPVRIDPTITDADWSTVATSINSDVLAMAFDGTNLYVGGYFTTDGDGNVANYIAQWDGSHWSTLGTGMDGDVWALAWDGSHLYAGGHFTTAGGVSTGPVAMWDGTTWSALGNGVTGTYVYSLLLVGSDLYVGGDFTSVEDASGSRVVNYVAKWNGSAWADLNGGTDGQVNALAWDGENLYAGGWFTTAGTTPVSNVAKWDGSGWSALGSVTFDQGVVALASDGTNLYAGGYFSKAGGSPLNYIAMWNGSSWSDMGAPVTDNVYALAWDGAHLYAGGQFATTVHSTTIGDYIIRWDGSGWSALGSGTNGDVSALLVDSANQRLFVGGGFTQAGGVASGHLSVVAVSDMPQPPSGGGGGGSSGGGGGGVTEVPLLALCGTLLLLRRRAAV